MGYAINSQPTPTPQALNKLLASCNENTHDPEQLNLALARSLWNLSIIEEASGNLVGFVRATSDLGLNANLWNLVAQPGELQDQLFAVLVHRALIMLRRDVPGCSISVSAPAVALKALKEHGFCIDPGGIKAMDFRLR
jgi:hypothetical protein